MPEYRHHNATHDIPMPCISDDAVVQIHNFIEHFLDLFEARYGHQIQRFYEDRSAHNVIGHNPQPNIDDPPF